MQNYISLQKATAYGGIEYGWRAERNTEPTGNTAYNLYWSEWNTDRLDYHIVPDSFAPGSGEPSGLDHSYLMQSAGGGPQWDLLYDFNPLTTTQLQSTDTVQQVRTGLAIRYLRSTAVPVAFNNRIQLATASGGLRRPYIRETSTGEPKTCDAPPNWDDFGYGNHSPAGEDMYGRPPWCFTVA